MIKPTIMAVFGAIGVILFFCSAFYFARKLNIGLPETLSIVNLAFTIFMILIMLITIWANDISLRKSTDRTVGALKEEVSKQIESYKNSSDNQIAAIKALTESQIKQAEISKKEKGRIDILTLRKEIEVNQGYILSSIKGRETHLKGETIIVTLFRTSAYEQGMITSYLTDEDLINEILGFYSDLYTANEFIKMAINTNIVPLTDKQAIMAVYNKQIINFCEKNKDVGERIIKKLSEIK